MWPNERDCLLAERILEDIETVEQRIAYFGLTAESFCNDHSFEGEIAYDAVMNPVYRIVEDACHLSDEFMSLNESFSWREMKGFRNFVAHGYGAINRTIAWGVIKRHLPELKHMLVVLLDE